MSKIKYFYYWKYSIFQLLAIKFFYKLRGWDVSTRYNSGEAALVVSKKGE